MASDTNPFFELVDALIHNRQQPAEAIATGLGVTFGPDSPKSTELAILRESGRSTTFPMIGSALIRTPTADSQVKRMVGINVDEATACYSASDVEAHFGKHYELDIPRPELPASTPLFHTYRKEWGLLKFGFSRQGAECLKAIHIEFSGA